MAYDLRFYLSLFLRRIHYFLLCLTAGTAVGVSLAVVLPPVFVASAKLIVESEQIPDELAATTVQTEAIEQLQIIQQRILTRTSLLAIADRLQIYGADAVTWTADEKVADLRERIVMTTTGGAPLRGPVQATIVDISFAAPDAQMSARVTNALVALILQENITIRTNVAGQTLAYFNAEVARLDQEMTAVGAEILAFQRENLNALPDSLAQRRIVQAELQDQLAQLTRNLAGLRRQKDDRSASVQSSGGPVTAAAGQTAEQRQLQGLKDELALMLAVFSAENPRVKMQQAQIVALEGRVALQMASGESGDLPFADLDGQLMALTAQKTRLETELAALDRTIAATPENAITLDNLEHATANLRAQYDQAVRNRARAQTGDTIEALAKGQRISVVEQASPPQTPDRPQRRLVAMAGIGAGFFIGLAVVVVLEMMTHAIRRPADLTLRLGITPFGTVPLIRTRWEIVQRQTMMIAGFAVAIVAIPALVWVLHAQVMPLDAMLDQVKGQVGL